MLEYPFFLYKEKPGAAFSFSPEGRFPFGRTVSADWPSVSTLERCAAVTGQELDAALDSDPLLAGLPTEARLHKFRYLPRGNGGRFTFDTVGATVKMPVREHERLFAALLGVAQTHGYSLVDPLSGMLWATPAEEERRPAIWMMDRRPQLLDDLQRYGSRKIFALPHAAAESFYVAVEASRYGKPSQKCAAAFMKDLGCCLWPGERIVPFAGRLVVEGPKGAYRFYFDWEGNGNHASWTADFREPECPIIPTRRSSLRMLRRTPSERSLVAAGMGHPAVVELVPDPAERYTMLHFANRKLLRRLPRGLLEELKAAAGKGELS